MFNKYTINPGVCGENDLVNFGIFNRSQWTSTGFSQTQNAFGQMALGKKGAGIGLKITNEILKGINRYALSGSYSRRIHFWNGVLAFGGEVGIYGFNIDPNEYNVKDENDVILTAINSGFTPDLSAGLFYKTSAWYGGISSSHLLQSELSSSGSSTGKYLREYQVIGGVKLFPHEKFNLLPTAFLKSSHNNVQLDVSIHLLLQNRIWIGSSYRTNQDLAIQCGVNINEFIPTMLNNFILGYSYDMVQTAIRSYSGNTHEIMLKYGFKLRPSPSSVQNKSKIISPIFFE